MTLTHPSPNFGDRRGGQRPRLVVIHYTAMATCAEALARLCDPLAEVSAHYLIDVDGTVLSLVAEEARAWHAGAGSWGGQGDVNSRSIGIELANPGNQPFALPQMAALEDLLQGVLSRWSILPQAVIGHSDMAPDRKGDPGPRFDWRGLALAGLSVWPDLAAPDLAKPDDFAADLAAFGYPDLPEAMLLTAFRMRFRPWAKGPLDPADRALAADLARRFPVDGAPAQA